MDPRDGPPRRGAVEAGLVVWLHPIVALIQNESEYSRRLPCSNFFREKCKIKRDEFLVLARYADHTSVASKEGNQAMLLVNEDRNCLAKEHGYKTSHTRMQPLTCTPKNFIMVGII